MSVVVDEGGAKPLSMDFIQTGDLAEVRARLREQRAAAPASEEQANVESKLPVASSSNEALEANEGAQVDEHDEGESESDVPKAKKPKKPTHVPVEELEKERTRFQSLSANTKAIADELAAIKQERETEKQNAEIEKRRQEYLANIAQIQREVPEHLQQQTIQAYQQYLLMGEQNAFGEQLQTQHRQLAEREADLRLQSVKMQLPTYVASIVDHVAETHSIAPDHVRAITNEPDFQGILGMYREPRDLALVAEMLNVFASYEAKRGETATEELRQQEIDTNVAAGTPQRIVSAGGRNSGRTTVQEIGQVPHEKWGEFNKYVKMYGTPAAALQAMKAGKPAK
jgi:hypothetical protein